VSTQGRGHIVRTSAQAESCPHGYGIYEKRSRKSRKYFKKLIYYIVITIFNLPNLMISHCILSCMRPWFGPLLRFSPFLRRREWRGARPMNGESSTPPDTGYGDEEDSETVVIEVT
jgi:hypothetical protein